MAMARADVWVSGIAAGQVSLAVGNFVSKTVAFRPGILIKQNLGNRGIKKGVQKGFKICGRVETGAGIEVENRHGVDGDRDTK